MSVIYLIRHGQASFGEDNYDKLSDLGVRQSQIVAQRLAEHGVKFDSVITGTLQRQIHTAQALYDAYEKKGLELPERKTMPEFNEYPSDEVLMGYLPRLEAKEPSLAEHFDKIYTDRRSFQLVFEKAMQTWASGQDDVPGITPWLEFTATVNKGLDAIMASHGSGTNVAVFSSGGPISVALQRTMHLSHERTMEVSWQVMNASITRLKFSGNRINLYAFNQFGHLEAVKDKTVLTYR
ncbi:histidine phosphatase family protein [Desulfatibacillum aliphaticivorans]|uniref:Phosphoglycerate mutase n=1 Tax=Desulfatibacillum aliphaticivorans TaxID=218208 RepID=B8FKJ5_DESAL|nr:histidine phosphatase family protein [Desulfatibacillum aliphaticivorans]ACL01810.1 Phosphoglycerate mutase [Desulfatibacillum aliphaticivorans]